MHWKNTSVRGRQSAAGEADPSAITRLCADGEEAADFILTYVVQARLNERGNYGPRFICLAHKLRFELCLVRPLGRTLWACGAKVPAL